MRFKVHSSLRFSIGGPSRLFLHLRALGSAQQAVERESLRTDPVGPLPLEPGMGGRESRLAVIDAAADLTVTYDAVVSSSPDLRPVAEVGNWFPASLDHSRAAYLFPSRYCESDQLGRLAWQKFGDQISPYAKAAAVTDWIHNHVVYLAGSTHTGTSACATIVQRAGVCRDFAHVGVAFCRALNLPARYVTGYACGLQPPDMHAWFEVAIGEHWVAFDATRLVSPRGLVRVAHGRDAADTAISTAFGPALALGSAFSCDPADPGEAPPVPGVPGEEPVLVASA